MPEEVHPDVIEWLMSGDPSIAFQCARDLLGTHRSDLQNQIAKSGWGQAFLEARNTDGTWGDSYYSPRWACTHFALFDLVGMGFPSGHQEVRQVIQKIARKQVAKDGGLGISPGEKKSDTCVTAIFLNIASYFGIPETDLQTFVDFLISVQVSDGGFNCQINRKGCRSSSLHSTISVLEALQRFEENGYSYRLTELQGIAAEARLFILRHKFFRSERTGETISPKFLKLSYPTRWYYNTLRGLDHFRAAQQRYDGAMKDALRHLVSLQRQDGRWNRAAKIPGELVINMEPHRGASRWNTLLALRVLKHFSQHLTGCEASELSHS